MDLKNTSRKQFNIPNKQFFVNASKRALFSLKVGAGYDDIGFVS